MWVSFKLAKDFDAEQVLTALSKICSLGQKNWPSGMVYYFSWVESDDSIEQDEDKPQFEQESYSCVLPIEDNNVSKFLEIDCPDISNRKKSGRPISVLAIDYADHYTGDGLLEKFDSAKINL